jgi:hypothetical protein
MKFKYFKQGDIHQASKFNFWEWHHFWGGLLVSIVGFWVLFNWSFWAALPILMIGLWVMIDDIVQHSVQWFEIEMTKKENYPGHYRTVTYLHWIFYKEYWEL